MDSGREWRSEPGAAPSPRGRRRRHLGRAARHGVRSHGRRDPAFRSLLRPALPLSWGMRQLLPRVAAALLAVTALAALERQERPRGPAPLAPHVPGEVLIKL